MKTITTLLLLLLASPVFAETYVCSYVNDDGAITTNQFTRTADGFQAGDFIEEIIYEDMELLVLHRTVVYDSFDTAGFITIIRQIEKGGQRRYTSAALQTLTFVLNSINDGTCTVVE